MPLLLTLVCLLCRGHKTQTDKTRVALVFNLDYEQTRTNNYNNYYKLKREERLKAMFNDLPESNKQKEYNKRKLFLLASISFCWIALLSTSTVANIVFYDAKLAEKVQLITMNCGVIEPKPVAKKFSVYLSRFPVEFPGCYLPRGPYNFRKENDALDDVFNSTKSLHLDEAIIQSSVINRVNVKRPSLAIAAKITGEVKVKVLIDEEGKVLHAKITCGHPLFQQAVLKAAKEWTFKPTLVDGLAVKVESSLTFKFN
jgi:TonB family protein